MRAMPVRMAVSVRSPMPRTIAGRTRSAGPARVGRGQYVVDIDTLPPCLLWTCTGITLVALAVAALLTARPGAADPMQPAPVITK